MAAYHIVLLYSVSLKPTAYYVGFDSLDVQVWVSKVSCFVESRQYSCLNEGTLLWPALCSQASFTAVLMCPQLYIQKCGQAQQLPKFQCGTTISQSFLTFCLWTQTNKNVIKTNSLGGLHLVAGFPGCLPPILSWSCPNVGPGCLASLPFHSLASLGLKPPSKVWVGKLPVGLMNGSFCPLADNLDRECLNPIFLWDSQMELRCWQSWLISTLTLQSVFTHIHDDLKAWLCLLPIAYQSDANDYCSGEGFNVHHLKESSFIYFLFPFLTSSTLH